MQIEYNEEDDYLSISNSSYTSTEKRKILYKDVSDDSGDINR